MGIDLGALSAKVDLNTAGFNSGVKKLISGFDSIGQRLMYLNQSLDLASRGFRIAQGAIENVIAPIYNTGRETARLKKSFEEITGSQKGAADEFVFLHKVADDLGQNFYDLTDAYKGIAAASKNTTLEGEGTRKIFEAVTKATASLGINAEGTKGALVALSQMISKGGVTAEELRQQLGERLPGAFNLMAEAVGVSTKELGEMMQKGEVGVEYLIKFADVLNNRYSGAVDEGTRAVNKFNEAWIDFKLMLGSGGFMNLITRSITNITQALKDPEAQRSLTEMTTNFASLIETGSKLALSSDIPRYINNIKSSLEALWKILSYDPAIIEYGLVGLAIGGKKGAILLGSLGHMTTWAKDLSAALGLVAAGYLDISNVANANFTELHKMVEQFDKNPILLKLESEAGALQRKIEDLQESMKYGLIPYKGDAEHLKALKAELEDVKLKIGQVKLEGSPRSPLGESFITTPSIYPNGKHPIVKKELSKAEEQAIKKRNEEINEAVNDLNQTIGEVKFNTLVAGMNDWDASVAGVTYEIGLLTDKYKELFATAPQLKTLIDELERLKADELKASAISDINRQVEDLNFQNSIIGLREEDQAVASLLYSFKDLAAAIPEVKVALDQLRAAQTANVGKSLAAQIEEEIKAVDFANSLIGLTEQERIVAELNFQWGELAAKFPEVEAALNRLGQVKLDGLAKETEDVYKKVADFADAFHEATQQMANALSEALVAWMETGDFSFKKLAEAMTKELEIVAAQRTAYLAMEALFHTIMAGIYMMTGNFDREVEETAAAAAAATGVVAMGSIVAGMGLAGMAHSGISSIPEDGTWLLKKNERVVDSKTNKDLKQFLAKSQAPNVNMEVNINGGNEESVMKSIPALRQAVVDIVDSNLRGNGRLLKSIKTLA